MSSNRLFKKIEKIIGEKFPAGLDKIIESAGFNTETSIYGLNSEEIKNIETYVNENKAILKNTGYEQLVNQSDANFKFKPGHANFLKGLPESLRTNKETKIHRFSYDVLSKIELFSQMNFSKSSIDSALSPNNAVLVSYPLFLRIVDISGGIFSFRNIDSLAKISFDAYMISKMLY